MTDYEKAVAIADKLRNMTNFRVVVTAEDVLRKSGGAELDFFYRWCCYGGPTP